MCRTQLNAWIIEQIIEILCTQYAVKQDSVRLRDAMKCIDMHLGGYFQSW